MVVCVDAASGTNGLYQLPRTIPYVRLVLLWRRLRILRQAADLRDVLCCGCCVGHRDHLESFVVTLFPVRPDGVVVEKPYLLEMATHSKRKKIATGDARQGTSRSTGVKEICRCAEVQICKC